MSNPRTVLAFSLVVLLLGPNARAEDPVLLRYQPKKGEKLTYRTVSSMKQTQTADGKEFNTEIQKTDVSMRTSVGKDEEGNFLLKNQNKQLKVSITGDASGEYVFDSKADNRQSGTLLSDSLNSVYDRLSGTDYVFTLAPCGEVLLVNGFQELLQDVLMGNPLGTQFVSGGTDESARASLNEQRIIFPEKPVKPGDTWEIPINVQLPGIGTFKGKRTYTFVGSDKVGKLNTVKINVRSDLTAEIDIQMKTTSVSGTLSVEASSGTVHFDPVAGRLVSMDVNYTLGGELIVNNNGAKSSMKTKQTQTRRVDLVIKK